ncbi:MAG: hypothetical protein ABEH81_04135 [Halopenitus sp.]
MNCWDDQLVESDHRERAEQAWGRDAQINKAAEECSELSAALNRMLNGQQDRDELLREYVDARLMLWQLELLFDVDEMEEALDVALDDLDERLEVFG